MRPWKRRDEPAPDPSKIGEVSDPPFVRLPEAGSLFATRAARLERLVPDHPLGDYLRFLAQISAAQHAVQAALPAVGAGKDHLDRLANGLPALAADMLRGPEFGSVLDGFLTAVRLADAPAAARDALAALRAMPAAGRLALASDIFDGAFPAERLGESLYVAAALQIFLARQAASLPAAGLRAIAGGGCPVCGNAPVASLIVSWVRAHKVRYCCCSLCGTLWNYVRIKCTACSSTEGISYYHIAEGSPHVSVETCTACHGYIKHLHQDEDPALDPVADDVASYGLDVMIRDAGFRRGGINPLFIC